MCKAECLMVSKKTNKNHNQFSANDFNSEEHYQSLDECIETASSREFYSLAQLIRGQPTKKAKTSDVKPIVFARLNSRLGKAKPVTLKCLLDSGASGSLIAAKHATKLKKKPISGPKMVWTTPVGTMSTTHKCQCTFLLPKFHRDRVVEWDINISPTNLGAYDMIIGR